MLKFQILVQKFQRGIRVSCVSQHHLQALGFKIPRITIFQLTIFWFRENSWEPTFISFNVQKQFSGNMLLNIL